MIEQQLEHPMTAANELPASAPAPEPVVVLHDLSKVYEEGGRRRVAFQITDNFPLCYSFTYLPVFE